MVVSRSVAYAAVSSVLKASLVAIFTMSSSSGKHSHASSLSLA
jgi:hypothetical protein